MVVGFCIVAWWPFAFRSQNQVTWLTGRPGLHFAENGIAHDAQHLPSSSEAGVAGQSANFTVELWVEPDGEATNDVFHLLTIHDGRLPSNFVLCQWKRMILLRVPSANNARGFREVGANGALEKGRPRCITITGSAGGTDFYLDGKVSAQFPNFVVSPDALTGRLIVGNAANGKHAWAGRLFGLAVYRRQLAAEEVARHHELWVQGRARQLAGESGLSALYLFDEGSGQWAEDHSSHRHQLLIPVTYSAPHKEYLILPWPGTAAQEINYRDILVNILGFAPFGFCWYLHRRSASMGWRFATVLCVVFVGAVISLGLETVQVWLVNRVSSLTDVVCNTAGTLLGVLLACALHGKLRRPNPSPEHREG